MTLQKIAFQVQRGVSPLLKKPVAHVFLLAPITGDTLPLTVSHCPAPLSGKAVHGFLPIPLPAAAPCSQWQSCLRCCGNSSLLVIVSRVLSHQRFLHKQALTCHVQLSHMETLQLQLSSHYEYSCYKPLGISQAYLHRDCPALHPQSGSRQESLCVGLLEQPSSCYAAWNYALWEN